MHVWSSVSIRFVLVVVSMPRTVVKFICPRAVMATADGFSCSPSVTRGRVVAMKKLSPNTRALRELLAKGGLKAAELRKLIPATTLLRHKRGVMPTAKHMIDYEMAFGWHASAWQTPKEWIRATKRTRSLMLGHGSSASPGPSEKP